MANSLNPQYTGDTPTDMLLELEKLLAFKKLSEIAQNDSNKLDPQKADALYTTQAEVFRNATLSQAPKEKTNQGGLNIVPVDEFNLSRFPTGYIDNPYFADQTPEQQEQARSIMNTKGLEAVYKAGLQPERLPHGKIAGAVRSFGGGVSGIEHLPTQGSSPVLNTIGSLVGEGVKYTALSRLGSSSGLTGISPEVFAGLASGTERGLVNDDLNFEDVAIEGLLAGSASGLFSAGKNIKSQNFIDDVMASESGIQKITPKLKTTIVPETIEQSTTLYSFGWSPEVVKSLQKSWEGVVDQVAEKAVAVIPKKITKFMHDTFVSPAPSEVKNILNESLTFQAQGKETARKIANELSGVPKHFQDDVYKFLDPQALDDPGALYGYRQIDNIPPEVLLIATNARNKLVDLGQAAVDAGLLDNKTFAKNIGEYLGRYYKSSPQQLKDAFKKFIVRGDRFKRRTLLTPEQRIEKGIITDAPYAVSKTIGELTFDIANANAFKKIAQNPEWTKPSNFFNDIAEATQAGFKKLPKDKRYGALSDTYIQKGIYDEITSIIPNNSAGARQGGLWREVSDFYDLALSQWKFGKTALNPATHGRNLFSNVILADLGGLSPLRVDMYTKALRDYAKKTGLYDEAASTGIFGTDWFGAEVKNYISDIGGVNKNQSMVRHITEILSNSKTARAIGKAGDLYQAEEHWFKMALYSHQRSLGKTPAEAAAHAQKYLFNYSDLSPFLKKLKRSPIGGPFLSFTAKSLPIMAETAVKHPVRFFKWVALFNGINEVSKANIGMTDEEYLAMEESLPDWQKSTFLTPRILLPTRDKEEQPIQLDLTYNLPWGQIGEQGQLFKNIPLVKDIPGGSILDAFVGSNPFTNLGVETITNRSLFTDKQIYNPDTETNLEALGSLGGHAYKQLAPGIALNLPPLVSAMAGSKTKDGKVVDPYVEALKRIVGLKLQSVDINKGLDIKISLLEGQQREIDKEINRILYNESLTRKEQDKRQDELMDVWEKYQKEIDRLDKIQRKNHR